MQKLYRDLTDSFRRGRGAISPLTFEIRVTSRLNHESERGTSMLLQASGYPHRGRSGDIYILKYILNSIIESHEVLRSLSIETNGK